MENSELRQRYFFDMRTGGQELIAQSVSRLCGLNAEHSSLCGN